MKDVWQIKGLSRCTAENVIATHRTKDMREKKSLRGSHPKLAFEADSWNTRDYSSGSIAKKAWHYPKNHIFEAGIEQLTRKEEPTTCPFVLGQKVLSDFNDLASINPALTRQAAEATAWLVQSSSHGAQTRLEN